MFRVGTHRFTLVVERYKLAVSQGAPPKGAKPTDRIWSLSDETTGQDLAGALVPDARLLDQLGPKTRETIARGAPYFLAAAVQGAEWDLRPAFRAAARDLILMRANDVPSVKDYLRQGSLLGDVRPAIVGVDHGQAVLEVLRQLANAAAKFGKLAKLYARSAAQNPRGQSALFASETLTHGEALKRAAAAVGVTL